MEVNCWALGLFTAVRVIGHPFGSKFRNFSSLVSQFESECVIHISAVLKIFKSGCSGVQYLTCATLIPRGDCAFALVEARTGAESDIANIGSARNHAIDLRRAESMGRRKYGATPPKD